MDLSLALHTMLRRHAEARFADHTSTYFGSKLPQNPSSPEARHVFPRYLAHSAMLDALERLEPTALPPLPAARRQFADLLASAASPMTANLKDDPIAQAAMAEERAMAAGLALTVPDAELRTVSPMPYRRLLASEEAEREWTGLASRWGIGDGYWYPLADPEATRRPDAELVAFEADDFHAAVPVVVLHELVAELGCRRVLEFREDGQARELALELFEPFYSGLEGYWTARHADWVIYASHESSVTVGGAELLAKLKVRWPAWREHPWLTGPEISGQNVNPGAT